VFRSVPVRHVTPQWLLARGWDSSDHLAEALKRASDVVLAAALLVACAPLLLIVALGQRLSERGPVFYSQVRVGRYGRPFRIHKLRTMRVDAETDGPSWAAPDDPRRTRLGGLLRRTRVDELPQLWNILRGDMSFVGPRPERPEFVAELERTLPFYGWRHLVRPGLTGWAQINYPYGAGVEDAERKLEFDLYYLRHPSWLNDAGIVLRTAGRALRGAR
jgi:lipopolysaccharide/colanic/teichoic acid biosynthesis glycosyltransferase